MKSETEKQAGLLYTTIIFLKQHFIFSLLTLTGMMPLIIFMDVSMDIMLFRDHGELKGMVFIALVIFYSEFTKKYRDN